MRILHIGADSIFLSRFSELIEESAPGVSEYLVLLDHGQTEGRHRIASPRARFIGSRLPGLIRSVALIRSVDVVIVHGMSTFAALAFLLTSRRTVRVWSGFGFDYYGSESSDVDGLLDERTRGYVGSTARRQRARDAVRRSSFRQAAAMSHFFSAPIPSDFEVFRAKFPSFRGGYLQLKYATLSEMVPTGRIRKRSDILIGNSAAYSNNHLDMFALVEEAGIDGRRIVVPLSYDGDPAYVSEVVRVGGERFGERFVPLVERQPLAEYVETVAGCSWAVMGQKRQKALGNLIILLHSGAIVYLDAVNPVLPFLLDLGVEVRELSAVAEIGRDGRPLDDDALARTRDALESFWGDEEVKRGLADALAVLARETAVRAGSA